MEITVNINVTGLDRLSAALEALVKPTPWPFPSPAPTMVSSQCDAPMETPSVTSVVPPADLPVTTPEEPSVFERAKRARAKKTEAAPVPTAAATEPPAPTQTVPETATPVSQPSVSEPAPTEPASVSPSEITLDDVHTVAVAYSKAHHRDKVLEVLGQFGIQALHQAKGRPELWPAMYAAFSAVEPVEA